MTIVITLIIGIIIGIYIYNLTTKDQEKYIKSDEFKKRMKSIESESKDNIRFDGYYICRFVAENLNSKPKMTQILIFNKKGYVFQEDWEGFNELNEGIMSECIIENENNTTLNPELTKYEFKDGILNLKYHKNHFESDSESEPMQGWGDYLEFKGKIIKNGLELSSIYHHSKIDGSYEEYPISKNLKFDFIKTERLERTVINCKSIENKDEKLRIWPTTYLIDKSTNTKHKLLNANGISIYPEWSILKKGETFSLIFEKLPPECSTFSLVEEIPESDGFLVENIKRNNSEFYEIEI